MFPIPRHSTTECPSCQGATGTEKPEPVIVSAIRDGKLVEVSWNDLTEGEKRDAYVALFHPCDWE